MIKISNTALFLKIGFSCVLLSTLTGCLTFNYQVVTAVNPPTPTLITVAQGDNGSFISVTPAPSVTLPTLTPSSTKVLPLEPLPPLPKAVTATPIALVATSTSTSPSTAQATAGTQVTTDTPKPTAKATTLITLTPTNSAKNLPKVATATPEPLIPVDLTISDAQATELAQVDNSQSNLKATNIKVAFVNSNLELTGNLSQLGIPLGVIKVVGIPVIENENLRFRANSVTLNNQSYPIYRSQAEALVNNVFRKAFLGKRIQKVRVETGNMHISALETP